MPGDARARIRQRLTFVAIGLDAGRYPEPEDAADHLLEVLESVHGPHRADLVEWVESLTRGASDG